MTPINCDEEDTQEKKIFIYRACGPYGKPTSSRSINTQKKTEANIQSISDGSSCKPHKNGHACLVCSNGGLRYFVNNMAEMLN